MFREIPANTHSLSRRRPVFGHGINDAPYKISYKAEDGKTHICPFYTRWAAMVERVYSPALHRRSPTYVGCSLEDSWHSFMAFRSWMSTQDWEGKHLDKDLCFPGNKHYGPSTCLFVPKELNNLLTFPGSRRGDLPPGVARTSINGYAYFVATYSHYGKQKRLGYFKNPEEAYESYKKFRNTYLRDLAKQEPCPRVSSAILKHIL